MSTGSNTYKDADDILEHFGIKGMHWGFRNASSVKKTTGDHRRTAEISKKGTPQLTNKQLKDHNERRNLETNFKRLNPTKIEKGHAKAKNTLSLATTAISIYALANTPIGKTTIAAGKNFLYDQIAKGG